MKTSGVSEVPLKLNKGGVPMDLTEKYILMSKAVEIQKLLYPGVRIYGTPFWYEGVVIRVFAGEAFYFAGFDDQSKLTVWLPTQSQLQKALGKKQLYGIDGLIVSFYAFAGDFSKYGFDTMEQLWLAFVMKEKYNKVWNNKERKWECCAVPTA